MSAGRSNYRSTCGICGKVHGGPCQWGNVCFMCGQTGHLRRDCLYRESGQIRVSGSVTQSLQASGHVRLNTQAGQTSGDSFSTRQQSAPAARGRAYAMASQEAQATPGVVTGTNYVDEIFI